MADVKSFVEALIFVSDVPLTLDRLCDILPEYKREEVRDAVNRLKSDFNDHRRGIFLAEVAGGFQFRTCSEYSDVVKRLVKAEGSKFSKPALETLAIIAYRQPVTRQEVEFLRGVDSGGVLKTLLDKNLVKILGKKNVPGKPLIYGTSRKFLETFNLKDLKSLPTLKEIQDLEETPFFEQQEELPLLDNSGNQVVNEETGGGIS